MTIVNENSSPAASLARATRKPRGSADGVWNEMLTLRDKYGWSQREVARLLDVSDAMVSYVMKQPGVNYVEGKDESTLTRQLFAPLRNEDGKIDIQASLAKALEFERKMKPEDAAGLAADIQNPEVFMSKRVANIARTVAARPPREQFEARSHTTAPAANDPTYEPTELELSMIKFVTAQKKFDELREKADNALSVQPTIAKSLQKQVLEAAEAAGSSQSELSKVLTSTHLKRMRDESAMRQAPTHDDPLPGFQQVAATKTNVQISPSAVNSPSFDTKDKTFGTVKEPKLA